ncbi:hypothetical protein Avbf_10600 [Armadillidium vulgare]|nr:hypothetical protein Avbf_10600 [Armadillidium vulgare]
MGNYFKIKENGEGTESKYKSGHFLIFILGFSFLLTIHSDRPQTLSKKITIMRCEDYCDDS